MFLRNVSHLFMFSCLHFQMIIFEYQSCGWFIVTFSPSSHTLGQVSALDVSCSFSKNIYCTEWQDSLLKTGNKAANMNIKNCSLYALLMATDQKPQKKS